MSLTEISYYIRKLSPFAIIGILVFLVLIYLIRVIILLVPARQNLPLTTFIDPVFKKIKVVEVPHASSSAGLNFKLDTIEGVPVTATSTAKINFLPPSSTRFGYKEKIYLMAQTVGFDTQNVKYKLEGTDALFLDGKQKLTVDITTFNFTYEYNYQNDKSVFSNLRIPEKQEIESKAVDLLKALGRYPDELARGKTNIIYFNYDFLANNLNVTDDPKKANVVEVDFYRPDIDGSPASYPVVSPDYFTSQNHVILLFNDTGFKVLKAQIRFFEKSDDQVGVYPIISGDTAWSLLKTGQGRVVSKPADMTNITVKKMFLAYYDPDSYQEFLQPLYVFLGDNSFVGYVPAVSPEYLSK